MLYPKCHRHADEPGGSIPRQILLNRLPIERLASSCESPLHEEYLLGHLHLGLSGLHSLTRQSECFGVTQAKIPPISRIPSKKPALRTFGGRLSPECREFRSRR